MAMLADKKKKQKWSNDPRNTTWSNDTNRFGYQLMTKMGWESGKGLGARENGQTSHVKARKRKTNIGLGADQSNDDSWLAHREAFNDLLSHLNDVNQNGDDCATEDTKYDMEKTARESRKRVFYNRFIKSKDASSYSQTDMACILGQRSKSAPVTPVQQSADSDSDDSSTASCPTAAKSSTSHGVVTVNTGLSIQEYFAKKMRDLQAARCNVLTDDATKERGEEAAEGKSDSERVESSNAEKKRKKDKRKRALVVDASTGENEDQRLAQKASSSKSKKKRKQNEKDEKEPAKTRRKKKRKIKNRESPEEEELNEQCVKAVKVRKRTKRRDKSTD